MRGGWIVARPGWDWHANLKRVERELPSVAAAPGLPLHRRRHDISVAAAGHLRR